MAEKETVYRLKFDINDTSTEEQRKKLELLKKAIIETENEVKALKTETKGNAQAQSDAAGKFSQLETKLFKLKSSYGEVRREAAGVKGFTDKIGDSFAKSLGPIQGMLGALGPIGQQLSGLGGKIGGIQDALSGLGKASTDAGGGLGKLGGFSSILGKGIGGSVLAIGGLIAGLGALGVGLSSSIDAYDASIKAQKQLETALGFTSTALLKQAEDLQSLTGFQDDAITKSQAFAASLGLTEEQILNLTPAVLDLAAATGESVDSAFEKVATTLSGGRDALKKYGIELDGSANLQERVGQVVSGLGDKFKGQAEAIVSVGKGPIDRFKNNIDDLQENIGRFVTSAINPFVDGMSSIVGGLNDLIGPSESAADSYRTQKKELEDLTKRVNPLVDEYDSLSKKTSLTVVEKEKLSTVTNKLAKEFPAFVTELKNENGQLAINTEGIKEYIKTKVAQLALQNADAIKEEKKNYEDLNKVYINAGKNLKNFQDLLSKIDQQKDPEGYNKIVDKINELSVVSDKAKTNLEAQQNTINELDGTAFKTESENIISDQDAMIAAVENGTATLKQLTDFRKKLNDDLNDNIAEGDKESIKAKLLELKLIDARIAKFKEEAKVKEDVNKVTDKSKDIQAAYDLEIGLIDALEEKKTITVKEADLKRSEALRKSFEDQINLQREKALEDGIILPVELEIISGLENERRKAEEDVKKIQDEIQRSVSDIDAKVKVSLQLSDADLQKEISDAVAADTIRKEFDDVFAGFANSLGQDVKDELKAAAIDGTINFDGLANADIPLKEIEKLKKSFFEYKKAIETNKLKLNIEKNDAELERLTKIFNELNGRKIRSEVDIDVKKLTPEEEELFAQTREDIKTTRTVNVKLEGDIAKIQDLEIPSVVPEDIKLGISDDDFNNILETYGQLNSAINDVFFQAQQERIQSMLDRDVRSLEENYQTQNDLLKASLDQNLITQAEYEQQRKENQSDLNAQRFKLESDAFKKEQKIRKAEATLNYFGEISNLAFQYSKLPPGVGQVLAAVQIAIATARYAGNIAQIQNAVPPTAERGAIIEFGSGGVNNQHSSTSNSTYNNSTSSIDAKKLSSYFNTSNSTYGGNQSYNSNSSNQRAVNYSYGGVPIGPRHSDGGIKVLVGGEQAVEMEGGEAVINRKSTAIFRPLLSQINSYGGFGRKFATGGVMPSEPISLQPSPELFGIARRDTINIASEQVQQQVVLYISELENKQSRINRTKDRVSFG